MVTVHLKSTALCVFICHLLNYFARLLTDWEHMHGERHGYDSDETDSQTRHSPVKNPDKHRFLISPSALCGRKYDKPDVFLLISVHSSPGNVEERTAIRQTWGSSANKIDSDIALVFHVGTSTDSSTESQIRQESATYRDVVQTSFVDSYKNLTLKSIAAVKWASTICGRARFLLKTDDDMFINVDNVISLLRTTNPRKFVMGSLIKEARPIRNKKSKWYTSPGDYPRENYPDFVTGGSSIFSMDAARDVYKMSLETPFFAHEDIYITGLCAQKLSSYQLIDNPAMQFHKIKPVTRCYYRRTIAMHGVKSDRLREVWSGLSNFTCL